MRDVRTAAGLSAARAPDLFPDLSCRSSRLANSSSSSICGLACWWPPVAASSTSWSSAPMVRSRSRPFASNSASTIDESICGNIDSSCATAESCDTTAPAAGEAEPGAAAAGAGGLDVLDITSWLSIGVGRIGGCCQLQSVSVCASTCPSRRLLVRVLLVACSVAAS